MLGGVPYPVTTLLGAMLHDVLARVTEAEGAKPDRLVLTHPANWGPFRRELFEEVPQVAGVTGPTTVTEPEAAAAHYASSRPLDDGETIAVYDLGGGTFDATVLRRHAGGIELLGAPEGIERLGGADFDESILSHVNYSSGGALTELDMGDPQTTVALARLRQDCVLAKEALSIDTEATIPVFLPHRHFDVRLTRADFEHLIRAQIESTVGTLVRTLRSADVGPAELSTVLLVGGSSRIPLVSRMISEELGRPTVVDTHPKYAVALGAAALAAGAAPVGYGTVASAGADQRTVPRSSGPPDPGPARHDGREERGTRASAAAAGQGAVLGSGRPGDRTERLGHVGPPSPHRSRGDPGTGPGRPPGRPGAGRRIVAVSAAVVLLLGVIALGVYLGVARLGSATLAAGGGTASTAVSAAPPVASVPASVAVSVPVPIIDGPPIPVGRTPSFAVASPSGHQIYVANTDANTVTVVDTAVNKVTASIPIPAGPPQFLAFSPDGRTVYVSVWNTAATIHAVCVLDTTTNSIVATIPVRTRPYLAAVTPDGKELYVPNHDSGTVSVVDTASDKVTTEIKVAPNPHWVGFSKDGTRAYTANHESNLVSVLDTGTNTVLATIPVDHSPHSLAVHPRLPLVANVNYDSATVTVIDTNTDKVVNRIPVGRNPQFITWSPDGRFAYVADVGDNTVSIIAESTMTVTATIPTGGSPTSIAVLPDGTTGYVTNLDDGTLTVLKLSG
jgi:YVTN family beta-propeller protein